MLDLMLMILFYQAGTRAAQEDVLVNLSNNNSRLYEEIDSAWKLLFVKKYGTQASFVAVRSLCQMTVVEMLMCRTTLRNGETNSIGENYIRNLSPSVLINCMVHALQTNWEVAFYTKLTDYSCSKKAERNVKKRLREQHMAQTVRGIEPQKCIKIPSPATRRRPLSSTSSPHQQRRMSRGIQMIRNPQSRLMSHKKKGKLSKMQELKHSVKNFVKLNRL